MACFHPIPAYRLDSGDVVFSERGSVRERLELPCGRCVGCRLERSRQWAVRCMHEASLYDLNSFITLTYSDEHLPPHNSLDYSHFQLFMKRLRKRFTGVRIRFYMCGEYGDSNGRPHYHALLFGFDFPDKKPMALYGNSDLYRSDVLADLWPFGLSSIGAVTFESAAYVARYIMKKITGPLADEHYAVVDPETGEIFQRMPEFARMSLKPGIGADWINRFHRSVYPKDRVISRGHPAKPPRYYDKLLQRNDEDLYDEVTYQRFLKRQERDLEDDSDERLAVREKVMQAGVRQFSRDL